MHEQLTGLDFTAFPPSSISGTVWHDINGDGVRQKTGDEAEPLLPGITVQCANSTSGILTTQTDEEGNYRFVDSITSGQHIIVVTGLTGIAVTKPDEWPHYDINLATGQQLTNLDFGIRLPASISGTVWNDLNCDGKKDTGEPGLDDWNVWVKYNNMDDIKFVEFTDEDGNYKFEDLYFAGHYEVWVEDKGAVQSFPTDSGSHSFDLNKYNVVTGKDFGYCIEAGQFSITPTTGTGGAISPADAVTVDSGADQTFTITPDTCYTIADVLVDGSSVGAVSSYSFTNVTEDHTIEAVFSQKSLLSVTPALRDVPATGGTSTFEIENTGTGAMNWTAESDVSWLTIDSGDSGTNSGTITVSYETNSGEARTGTITVTAPGAENSPQTVEVRQAENFFYCTDKLSAKTTLTLIAREQEAYFAEHCAYSDSLEDIGVTVENNSKYQYEIDVSSDVFTATATSKAPGIGNSGQGDDIWTINQDWNLENGHTTSQECSEDKIIDGYLFIQRAIIGILSSISIPDFQLYRCKGYQNEAVNSLKSIHTAAEAYRMDFFVYPDSIEKAEMAGWSAEPDAKYHYAIIVADGDTFLATATSKEPGIVDGGEGDDVWTINQDGELVNSVNACQTLPPPPPQPITEKKPLLVLPFNGQINMSLTPELLSGAFSEDTGTDRGQWQISTSSDFSSPVLDETGDLGETIDSAFKSYVVPESTLNEGTVYYWRVRYYNADNESSEWSDIFWFRTTGTSEVVCATFTVNFTVKGNGTLTGEASQSVEYGKNCTGMTAVPNESYKFTGWSGDHDGTANPLIVENVTSDMNIIANFARHFELSDAILILDALTGAKANGVSLELDANGDGKVGMEDVVCILQIIAEIRSQ
ncbi:SdrD B-like domain-containing protein [Desulfococcaceae bacterium HSG7]|nr:SdrD B-like domain-containing protein [Desulfococcaceae bacterium HSG7]